MRPRRISFLVFALISVCVDAQAKCDYEIKLSDQRDLCIVQVEKEYGVELVISIIGEDYRVTARNGFLVALDNPTAGIVCWIGNGESFRDSFQIIDFKDMRSRDLCVDPLPVSDELRCMVSDDEKYFLIYDDFPERKWVYVYNRLGGLVLARKQELTERMSTSLIIDGEPRFFSAVHVFGGFSD